MRRSLTLLALCAGTLAAQDAAELKHFAMSTDSSLQPVRITARQAGRTLPYDGVLHLEGSVEIKTPVCLMTGPGTAHTCAGYVVLRADRADFHEDSGLIEASGNVRVTRER